MPLPFDATLKDLVRLRLGDYADALHLEGPLPAAVFNVDLSTITAATDVALGFGEPLVCIYDVNFQASYDANLGARILLYNALLHFRFEVPVHSIVILLRREANDPSLNGKLRYQVRKKRVKMNFSFEVLRLWRRPVRSILEGGLGMLPLASLCQFPGNLSVEEALPGIIRQMDERLQREATAAEAARIMSAAYVLSGLRVPGEVSREMFRGVRSMRESSTYQLILEEGEISALQKTLLRLGRKRFGAANKTVKTAIEGITDRPRLERMTEQLLLRVELARIAGHVLSN